MIKNQLVWKTVANNICIALGRKISLKTMAWHQHVSKIISRIAIQHHLWSFNVVPQELKKMFMPEHIDKWFNYLMRNTYAFLSDYLRLLPWSFQFLFLQPVWLFRWQHHNIPTKYNVILPLIRDGSQRRQNCRNGANILNPNKDNIIAASSDIWTVECSFGEARIFPE